MSEDQKQDSTSPSPLHLKSFLENVPPGSLEHVQISSPRMVLHNGRRFAEVAMPDISLYCESDPCGGMRTFALVGSKQYLPGVDERSESSFWTFSCRNCQKTEKTFALEITCLDVDAGSYAIRKYGEVPAFGPPLSNRLLELAGRDRDYLFKGRRCENQGLGIAAFAYYRRVLDARRDRLFAEILRVCRVLDVDAAVIVDLEATRAERQFTKAVEKIKHALPDALLVNGHNPLTLLYDALSEGLHTGTDQECLELATTIRLILSELLERLSQALKEDVELAKAVNTLVERKNRAKK
jgi:hypothetical protein